MPGSVRVFQSTTHFTQSGQASGGQSGGQSLQHSGREQQGSSVAVSTTGICGVSFAPTVDAARATAATNGMAAIESQSHFLRLMDSPCKRANGFKHLPNSLVK
jgi:hypothetical protein